MVSVNENKKAASGYTIYNWGTLQIFIDAFNKRKERSL